MNQAQEARLTGWQLRSRGTLCHGGVDQRAPLALFMERSLVDTSLVPYILQLPHYSPKHKGGQEMSLTGKRVAILAENNYQELERGSPFASGFGSTESEQRTKIGLGGEHGKRTVR